MDFAEERVPALRADVVPPLVRGVADLTTFAYQGAPFAALLARIDALHAGAAGAEAGAARLFDESIAEQLRFSRAEGLAMQDAALARCRMFRVLDDAALHAADAGRTVRLLAIAAPGDLMVNTPLDFLTSHLNVRLDLLYVLPDRALPAAIPDHDVAFFACGEADAALRARLARLFALWPRPALNDPAHLPAFARDRLARALADAHGICSPRAVAVGRWALADHLDEGTPIEGFAGKGGPFPCLIRPLDSHAGAGLARVETKAALAAYLEDRPEAAFFVTAFEDYAGADGLYRKLRVAFIDGAPFLCHMAVSSNWMVHYLNAGMTDSPERRAEEARAMAEFDAGFARRHAGAFAELHARLPFDYYSIDCAESRDGRLLVFEADVAAIVHLMDPPDLFPYKPPQMRRVFAAFGAMLRRRMEAGAAPGPVHSRRVVAEAVGD